MSYDCIVFKCKTTYFYSLVDLSQSEFLLSGLKELFKKQNEDNSQLQNKLHIKPVENNGMLLYLHYTSCYIVFQPSDQLFSINKNSKNNYHVSFYHINVTQIIF